MARQENSACNKTTRQINGAFYAGAAVLVFVLVVVMRGLPSSSTLAAVAVPFSASAPAVGSARVRVSRPVAGSREPHMLSQRGGSSLSWLFDRFTSCQRTGRQGT